MRAVLRSRAPAWLDAGSLPEGLGAISALIEACINAFEHSESKDRRVYINFDIGDRELTIRISDKGPGFDPGKAKAEVVERRERRESRRGWGLTLMEELMDEVKVQSDENGTVLTMVKRR